MLISGLYSVNLCVFVCVCVPVPYCFDICSFIVSSEVKEHNYPRSVVLSEDSVSCSGSLCNHTNVKIICSNFVKIALGILIGIAINLGIA